MKKKLNCVLLVEDDSDSNFFHKRLLQKMECTEKVHVAKDGLEAITWLQSNIDDKIPGPALIFLDINMPRFNGWEFLDEYEKLDENFKSHITLTIVTTSLNPDDKQKALGYKSVKGFENKEFNKESLNQLFRLHFAGNF